MNHKRNSQTVARMWRMMFKNRSLHGMPIERRAREIITARGLSVPKGATKKEIVALAARSKGIPTSLSNKATDAPKLVRARKRAKGADFYKSWDWKRVRYEAIRRCGQRCMCCGWKPGDTEAGYLVVDHIKSRRTRPDLELVVENLQVLCNDCNMGKGWEFSDDWRAEEV